MERLNLNNKSLKKFGITMGIAFFIIALLLFIRHKQNFLPILSISAVFFASAFIMPLLLNPVYILWMKFAFVLSWVNTRIILFIIFYLIFTPIGLLMRILGIDLLDRKPGKNRSSYWQEMPKRTFSPLSYEKQF